MHLIAANPILESYFQSDLFGKLIFLSLGVLSLITWILFLNKALLIKQWKKEAEVIRERFSKQVENPLALEFRDEHPFSIIYRGVKKKTVEMLKKNKGEEAKAYLYSSDMDQLETTLFNFTSGILSKVEKNLFVLSTIVTLAPFLGLLGTVWGILLTFSNMYANPLVDKNSLVMGGLSMALGTTIVGLVVAIPALIGHNMLKSSTAYFASQMEDFGHSLISSVEYNYRRAQP